VPCHAGRYFQNISCLNCPLGQYQPETAQDSCLQCPGGSSTGAPTGGISCTQCLAGKHFKTNTGMCLDCALGQYQPDTAQGSCLQCPSGKHAGQIGSSVCSMCPRGKFKAESTLDLPCLLCPYTKFQKDAGQVSCISCTECASGEINSKCGTVGSVEGPGNQSHCLM
jgi:CUB/sushi domain-containing protein